MDAPQSFKDQLLIAMPGLGDPNFNRGVTYVCQHNEEGAVGLLINRASEYQLVDILAQMDIAVDDPEIADWPVFIGGPVRPDRGFVLHSPEGEWESSLQLTDDLCWTTSRDILEAVAMGAGPNRVLIALGYAGWGAGQLEAELMQNAWLTAQAEPELIFETPVEQRWQGAAAAMGIDIRLLSDHAGTA